MASILTCSQFQRLPVPLKRRRGPLPRGVVSIKVAERLRVGDQAEIVGNRTKENNGIRVLITHFDPRESYCWLVKSLGQAIRCNDGSKDMEVWLKTAQLRRLWTGLSENQRLRLRMERGTP